MRSDFDKELKLYANTLLQAWQRNEKCAFRYSLFRIILNTAPSTTSANFDSFSLSDILLIPLLVLFPFPPFLFPFAAVDILRLYCSFVIVLTDYAISFYLFTSPSDVLLAEAVYYYYYYYPLAYSSSSKINV